MKSTASFNSDRLKSILLKLTASKIDRKKAADFVNKNPQTLLTLLEWALTPKKRRLYQTAAWVLEFILIYRIEWLQPHFDYFLKKIPKINSESSKRPLSKILYHYVKSKEHFNTLTKKEKLKIITLCFEWILLPSKTATIAFAIKILILFQKEFPWVKENLSDLTTNKILNTRTGLGASLRAIFKK